MKRTPTLVTALVLALMLALIAGLSVQLPQRAAYAQDPAQEAPALGVRAPQAQVGTAFTYQGRLKDAGSPANGEYDFRFRLYDAATSGTLLGTATAPNHPVSDGLFTAQLDFGQVFTGTARYLEISVRPGASTGAYTTLSPRQELTPVPYALALPGLWTEQNPVSPNIIGGYSGNSVAPGVEGAVIGGGGHAGYPNAVLANYDTIGGGRNNTILDNSPYATVGGGSFNIIRDYNYYATIGGGRDNSIGTGSSLSTIGGGDGNDIGDNSLHATIGGGGGNDIGADSDYATIGGGRWNDILADSDYATIGGGISNVIGTGSYSTTIGGGWQNDIGANSGSATIGGGWNNNIGGNSSDTTIGGGVYNDIGDGSGRSTIGGGRDNDIGNNSGYATVGGGQNNDIGINSDNATISGGAGNDIGDSSDYATIPGGQNNEANANYAFAAGRRAHANNQGCFVWGDSTDLDVHCNDDNRWVARASGGVWFFTNSALALGSRLAANGTSWGAVSARHLKENFSPVDTQALLARLAENPITTWNYKAQDPSIRHIGPMAEDFNTLLDDLGGEGEEYINTLDADGVALAAIQGLYQLSQGQAARIEELEAENAALREQVDALEQRDTVFEARLAALERGGTFPSLASGMPIWLLLGGLVLVGGVVLQWRRAGGGA